MLTPNDQLTELVRHLESRQHVFATDPWLVTEKLKSEAGSAKTKLYLRAKRIDSNGALAKTLNKISARIKAVMSLLSLIWLVTGFLGLFTLLQSKQVNFFYVLISILGVHTIMLIAWMLASARKGGGILALMVSPSRLIGNRDDVSLAAAKLYEEQLHHSGMRWYLGKFGHQLWLATLTGMLLAIISLLIVRQYSFSWESTLLSDEALITLTQALGFLPSLVGFDVPSAKAIIQSRLLDGAMPLSIARQWASLLIGSVIIYGIVPRALAWLFCTLMLRANQIQLDIKLPYYQKIVQFWQNTIVDHDDFNDNNNKAAQKVAAPKAKIASGQKLAVLLEYPSIDANWWQQSLGTLNVEDFGLVDDRDELARLLAYLQLHPVQVIVGINSQALPDRGILRKLDQINQKSAQGMAVLLIGAPLLDQNNPRYQQWHEALSNRQIAMVEALA